MSMLGYLIFVVFLVVSSSGQNVDNLCDLVVGKTEYYPRLVDTLFLEMSERFRSHDYDALQELYDDDDAELMMNGREKVVGNQNIANFFAGLYGEDAGELIQTCEEVNVMSSSYAYKIGTARRDGLNIRSLSTIKTTCGVPRVHRISIMEID